jgi:hypothetical protein
MSKINIVNKHYDPYINYTPNPNQYMMSGSGAVRPTTFGVIGMTKPSDTYRIVGGLIPNTKSTGALPMKPSREFMESSERHIFSSTKTKIPGSHYGQVPYPGVFQCKQGSPVS